MNIWIIGIQWQILGEDQCLLDSLTLQDQNDEVWNTIFTTLRTMEGPFHGGGKTKEYLWEI